MSRIATLLIAVVLAFAPCIAGSQAYPTKPIKFIVPFGPGGSGDITARLFARYLEDQWKQPVAVENRPGANGLIGTEAIKNSPPDGYTIGLASGSTHAAAPYLFKTLPYDPLKDFEHVGLFGVLGSALVVTPGAPFKTVPELVAYSKANPGKVFFGYFNTSSQVPAEILRARAGIPIEGVSYKTIANAIPDLVSGRIQFMFIDYVAASAHITAGRFVPIAISEAGRLERWPNVPAVAEFYPGYEIMAFLSLEAPAGTPRPVVARLNQAMRDAQADPAFKEKLEAMGLRLTPYTAEQYREFLVKELRNWAGYAKAARIEPQ